MRKITLAQVPNLCLSPRLKAHEPFPARLYQARFSVVITAIVAFFAIGRVFLSSSPMDETFFLLVFGASSLALLGYRFMSRPELVLFAWMISLVTLETIRGYYAPTLYMTVFAWLPLGIGLTCYLAGAKLGGLFTLLALGQTLWNIQFAGRHASRSSLLDPMSLVHDLQINLLAAEIVGGLAIFCFGVLRERSEHELEQRRIARSTAARKNAVRDMLGHLAHELNNPLAIIHSCLVQYANELGRGPLSVERQLFFQQCIDDAYARINRVSFALRGFADEALERSEIIGISELWHKAEESIDPKLKIYGLTLESRGGGLHDFLKCRPQEMVLVLATLLDILCEIAGKSSRQRKIVLEVESSAEILSVRMGNGDFSAQRESDSHPWARDSTDSIDLRLSACQRVILEHDGCLGLVKEHDGVVFWFELPKSGRD